MSNRDGLAARWAVGILQGHRQGETLGMRWPQIILDPDDPNAVPEILGGKQLQRRKWLHGCDDPGECNRGLGRTDGRSPCKREWCPPKYAHGCDGTCGKKLAHFCPAKKVVPGECSRHERVMYCRPCPENCRAHASTCPQRKGGGLVDAKLKTRKSSESAALADIVVELLRAHREKQILHLAEYGLKFDSEGYAFIDTRVLRHGDPASVKPLNPRRDWELWRGLQERAGISAKAMKRLHAARHTAGTYLRATGSDLKMVADVLRQATLKAAGGYSNTAMAAKRDAVNRMAALLMDGDLTKIMGALKGASS